MEYLDGEGTGRLARRHRGAPRRLRGVPAMVADSAALRRRAGMTSGWTVDPAPPSLRLPRLRAEAVCAARIVRVAPTAAGARPVSIAAAAVLVVFSFTTREPREIEGAGGLSTSPAGPGRRRPPAEPGGAVAGRPVAGRRRRRSALGGPAPGHPGSRALTGGESQAGTDTPPSSAPRRCGSSRRSSTASAPPSRASSRRPAASSTR